MLALAARAGRLMQGGMEKPAAQFSPTQASRALNAPVPMSPAPVSIVIPTLNAGACLPACLGALAAGSLAGLVREAVVVDGGSADETATIADGFGARVISASPGRGGQLKTGAAAARGEWLLFLHADTVLEDGWPAEVSSFIESDASRIGVFTLAFDARGLAPRIVAAGAMARTRWLKSPYGDQGLLVSRSLYDAVGGFSDMPLFEDVDLMARLVRHGGRKALHVFRTKAVTSPERYERDGYAGRVIKNAWHLAQYRAGVAPEKLARSYR